MLALGPVFQPNVKPRAEIVAFPLELTLAGDLERARVVRDERVVGRGAVSAGGEAVEWGFAADQAC